jgi:hypothetical protein
MTDSVREALSGAFAGASTKFVVLAGAFSEWGVDHALGEEEDDDDQKKNGEEF